MTAAAAVLAMSVMPVSAAEMTNVDPAGNTEVTANVSNSGDVTYLISIPDKINFGTLQQPKDNSTEHLAKRNYTVEAVQITGLDTTNSRVAVVLRDPDSSTGGFKITGQSASNSGKALNYSIYNNGTDITVGNMFQNGYLLTTFDKAGESVTGELRLEQNQLYGVSLEEWAGSYKGTISFYSRVASLDEIK